MSALRALEERTGVDVFTVRDINAEMVAAGTQYAESTVFKTVQRMKASPVRPPYARLEPVGREGFRLKAVSA